MLLLFPTRAIALLMFIGFADLISTAALHQQGLITELNPLMRTFIERGEWQFVVAKSATLFAAWIALCWYCRHNIRFVRRSCLWASAAYLTIWMGWFATGVFTR